MKTVSELLEGLQYEVIKGDTDRTVSDLVCDTRKVTEGCLFVCVKGASYDSHEHVDEIVQKHATLELQVLLGFAGKSTLQFLIALLFGDTRLSLFNGLRQAFD